MGGWLVGVIGAVNVVLVQAVTLAVSALAVLAFRTPEPPASGRPAGTRLRAEIRQGLACVWHNPFPRATALAAAAGNFSFAVASAVTFVFMAQTLEPSPALIAAVIAADSVAVVMAPC